MKNFENATRAFTEWLDQEQKEYFVVVRDIDGDGTNLCAMNGCMESLTVTLSSGMIDHDPVEQLLINAVLMTAMKKYSDKHGVSLEDLRRKLEDEDDDI